MWDAAIAVVGSMLLEKDIELKKQELKFKKQIAEQEFEWLTRKPVLLQKMYAKPPKKVVTKCPACGSHEFRKWHSVVICTYCRCSV